MLQQLLQYVVQAYWGAANETVGFTPACVTGFTSHKTLKISTDAEGIIALEQRESGGGGEEGENDKFLKHGKLLMGSDSTTKGIFPFLLKCRGLTLAGCQAPTKKFLAHPVLKLDRGDKI